MDSDAGYTKLRGRAACGKTTAVGRHAPNLAGGRWNRSGIGWGDPVEGQAPIGPTKSPPGDRRSGVSRRSRHTCSCTANKIARRGTGQPPAGGDSNLRRELALTFGQAVAGARTAAATPMLID